MAKRSLDTPAKLYEAAKRAGELLARNVACRHCPKEAGDAYAASVRRGFRTFPQELEALQGSQSAQDAESLAKVRQGLIDGGVPEETLDRIEVGFAGGEAGLLWLVDYYAVGEKVA